MPEISIVRKSFLWRKKTVIYESWDDMSPADFTAFCAVLRRSYFDQEGRLKMSTFLDSKPQTSKIVVPSITVRRKIFLGPLPGFRKVRYGELAKADALFDEYARTGNEDYLCYFVACLYREIDPNARGDRRVGFLEDEVSERASYFSKYADRDDLFAISINYVAVMDWILGRYKFLFPPPEDDQKKASAGERGRGYLRLARAMSDGKTDFEMQKVYDSYALNIFDSLNEQIMEDSKK